MTASCSICIPFTTDHHERALVAEWTIARWRALCPDAEICIGEDVSGDALCNRSRMRNNAVKQATRDVLLIVDADVCIYHPAELTALSALSREVGMATYFRYLPLRYDETVDLLSESPDVRLPIPHGIESRSASFAGAMFCITRKYFDQIGGFDERCVGWGCEDPIMLLAIETFCGPIVRVPYYLYHLWHANGADKNAMSPTYLRNRELWEKYNLAQGDPVAMRRVIEEPFLCP
jgi:hypothetical protein